MPTINEPGYLSSEAEVNSRRMATSYPWPDDLWQWMVEHDVHVLWIAGSWHAMCGDKVLTFGLNHPRDAILRAMKAADPTTQDAG